jgi:DNA-binding transcriptional ArsR family regulator
MSYVPQNSRVRSTSSTKRRDQKVAAIIAALREGPMRRADIREALDLSGSGVNKYLAQLSEAGVVEIARRINPSSTSQGTAVFRLVRDTDRVDDYLRSVEAGSALREKPKQPRAERRLPDNSPFRQAPLFSRIPAPDPVLAHFFGLTQARASA